ncbi:MAG: hypothetical protein ACXVCI_10090, partial [Bdellovibrionota bacterium]
MRFLALLPALLLSAPALADNVILMVNMNYSSSELQAVKEQAIARSQGGAIHQRVEMVPPESMIALAEPMFALRDQLLDSLQKQFPNMDSLELRSALAGIMRVGPSWNTDSAVADFLGQAQMNNLYRAAQRVAVAEKTNGEMYDQLKRKAAELQAKGDRVDSVVLSSHSDGSNLTGETANRLSANDLYRLRQEAPSLFDNARNVLLLGCYNMTQPNHRAWRYDLFPRASMLAGFGIKAPSRFDDTSPNFIRQVMGRAQQLDSQTAALGHPLDPVNLQKAFTTLSTFTTAAHPGVVDYCYSIVEGQPNTWKRDCDTQWADLFKKSKVMQDYWSLTSPVENPAPENDAKLRNFYNSLQEACPAIDTNSQKNDWQNTERFRVTFRENVIRLIFWWNVQANFATYYASDIPLMNSRLAAAGIRGTMPSLDGTTG